MSYKFRVMSYLSDIKKSLAAAFLLLCGLAACSDEADMPVPGEGESIKVPISFSLLDEGTLTTRADYKPSPDDGESYGDEVRKNRVDMVDVYVYHRAADGGYRSDIADFEKGATYSFPVEDKGKDAWPRFEASGEIEMSSSQEYRLTAVAYSKEERKEKPFSMTGYRLEHAEIQTDVARGYNCPELFFGTVVWGTPSGNTWVDADTIFTYNDAKNDKTRQLGGWLYRGVAGIELTFYNVHDTVVGIDLLADTVYTKVHARYYDDFVSAYAAQKDTEKKHFFLGAMAEVGSKRDSVDADGDKICYTGTQTPIQLSNYKLVGPNLLTNITTSLSVRIKSEYKDVNEETKERYTYARLRLKENSTIPGPDPDPDTKTIPDGDGTGTGIITDPPSSNPEDPDADDPLAPFRVKYIRNNYYTIEGDYNKLITQQYTLRVIVNPNWDQKVSLTLEEAGDGTSGQ